MAIKKLVDREMLDINLVTSMERLLLAKLRTADQLIQELSAIKEKDLGVRDPLKLVKVNEIMVLVRRLVTEARNNIIANALLIEIDVLARQVDREHE